jgi:hypothetical protein
VAGLASGGQIIVARVTAVKQLLFSNGQKQYSPEEVFLSEGAIVFSLPVGVTAKAMQLALSYDVLPEGWGEVKPTAEPTNESVVSRSESEGQPVGVSVEPSTDAEAGPSLSGSSGSSEQEVGVSGNPICALTEQVYHEHCDDEGGEEGNIVRISGPFIRPESEGQREPALEVG